MNMFVLTRNVSASYRVIATLVTAAVVLWAMGAYSYAEAANVENASDLMSDSAPGVGSDHTITFNLVSTLADAETIVIDFDDANGFDFTGVTAADFAITVGGTGDAVFTEGVVEADDTITFTKTGGTAVATDLVTITIDGTNQIVNPSPADGNESYEIDISAGTDIGHTRVVILDTVLVTANIETTFEFTVAGTATTTAVNGTNTTITSSTTTIPFGTLVQSVPQVLAQNLAVVTNARNGFVVTLEEDQHLESSTGADIDNFVDSVTSAIPVGWISPSTPDITDENTWGHWGITSEDATTTRSNQFTSDTWVGVSTTPQVVFSHTGPADGLTEGEGATRIGYQVEISALQEAADDYNTTLTYIATPTF